MRHIVALRGDPPPGQAYEPHPGGYHYASDLVAGLRKVADFEISVAAYPEVHPAASSPVADLENLKRKLDAGATRAITQYFFDTSTYLRFLDLCLAAGITAPIVPGIMPVSNFAQAVKFSDMCGASVPGWMGRLFEGTENDPETRRMVGMVIAAEQVRLLQANGVDEFHFYTLNRPDLTYAIAHVLGVRAEELGASQRSAPTTLLWEATCDVEATLSLGKLLFRVQDPPNRRAAAPGAADSCATGRSSWCRSAGEPANG